MHGSTRCLRAFRLWLLSAALAALSLSAQAVTLTATTDVLYDAATGNFRPMEGSGSGTVWTQGAKTPTATGPMKSGPPKSLPFNPSPTANFRASFTAANMARAMARPLAPLAFGAAMSYLMGKACTQLAGGVMTLAEGGQWEECNLITVAGWRTAGAPSTDAPDRGTSCNLFAGDRSAASGFSLSGSVQGSGPWQCVLTNMSANPTYVYGSYSMGTASIQMKDPEHPWKSATTDRAEALLQAKMNEWTQADFLYGYDPANRPASAPSKTMSDVLDDLLKGGGKVEAKLETPTIQTPTLMSPPVTTTTTDPSTGKQVTTTETTKNDYSCLVIENGLAIQCNQYKTKTTTTNTVDPSTNTNNTVTTTSTEQQQQEQTDPCIGHPDRLGCATFGAPGNADTLSKDSRAVSITPVLFGGGSCPGPVNFMVFGRSYQWTYDGLCAKLVLVSYLLLSLSTVAAAYIFTEGLRA